MTRKESLQQLFDEIFNKNNLIGKKAIAMYVIDKNQALDIAKKYGVKIKEQE